MSENTDGESDSAMPITVFLLDDHEIVRRGVAELVEAETDMTVIGEASSAAETMRFLAKTKPDVAVLDVRLQEGNGIDVCRDIRSTYPEIDCLMLTSFSDDRAIIDASIAGAAGYVLKQVKGNEIVTSIRKIHAGAILLDNATVRMAMRRIQGTEEALIEQLTPQESRIFELIGEGLSNRQIAEELGLAEKTVKNYASSMFMKLGVHRRTEAAALAVRRDERRRRMYE